MDGNFWFLKHCNLFEKITLEEAQRLNVRAVARTFRRSDLVYSPTEPGESVLILAKGRIKIYSITPDGRETILAFIEPGEIFGELALIDEQATRQEFAESVEESRVLRIERSVMQDLMHQKPDLVLSITKLIGLRRRRIENRLQNLLFLSSRDRIIHILKELEEQYGEGSEHRRQIRLRLSHQDIAGLVGVSRETVTLTLNELADEGWLEIGRRRIILKQTRRFFQSFLTPPPNPSSRPKNLTRS